MPIQLSGLASGIDTASIVTQLVAADSGTLNTLQTQSEETADANTTLSSIGTSLSALSTAATALSDSTSNGSFTASSSDASVGVTAQPSAQPGTYSLVVNAVAESQRTYSASFADSTSALNQSGTIQIAAGTSTPVSIEVDATDSLESIAAKINDSGAPLSASIFNDGTTSRLQIRGNDTGAANAITFTENGTALDLNGTGATPTSGITAQKAQDASLKIDGFVVTRPTNQITDAINGLNLTVTAPTTTAANIVVAGDSTGLATNINAVVTAYNAVITAIQKATGYGTVAAQNPVLAGDPALRQISGNLSSMMSSTSSQSGSLTSLADIGLTLQEDGTVALDSSKLTTAFSTDAGSVEKLLGRLHDATKGGLMANLNDLVGTFTAPDGALTTREQSLTDEKTSLDQRASDEQERLTAYQTQLQQQFTAMETVYSQNQNLLAQVQKIGT